MKNGRIIRFTLMIAQLVLVFASGIRIQAQEVMTNPGTLKPQLADPTGDAITSKHQPSLNENKDSQPASKEPEPRPKANQGYTFPTSSERFGRYVRNTIGPASLARSAVLAGIAQWRDRPVEWGQGATGFGKRYASDFGRNAIQQSVTYGLDRALELDTGFERSERQGFWPRVKDALGQNITSRNKAGRRVISVPRLTGVYAAGIIATESWYPARYNYKDGLRSGTNSLLSGFGINLVREFVFSW